MSVVATNKKTSPIDVRTALQRRAMIPDSWKKAAGVLSPERARQMLAQVAHGRKEWDARMKKLGRARSTRA